MHFTFLSRRSYGSAPLPSVSGQDSEVACRVARRSRTFSKRQRTNRRDVERTSPKKKRERDRTTLRRWTILRHATLSRGTTWKYLKAWYVHLRRISRACSRGVQGSGSFARDRREHRGDLTIFFFFLFFRTRPACYVHTRAYMYTYICIYVCLTTNQSCVQRIFAVT